MKTICSGSSIVLLGMLLLVAPSVALADDQECEVTTSASQIDAIEGEAYTEYTFEVTLEIEVQCAMIYYALEIDERVESGELEKRVMGRTMTMRSSMASEYHKYKTPNTHTIEGQSIAKMSCRICL